MLNATNRDVTCTNNPITNGPSPRPRSSSTVCSANAMPRASGGLVSKIMALVRRLIMMVTINRSSRLTIALEEPLSTTYRTLGPGEPDSMPVKNDSKNANTTHHPPQGMLTSRYTGTMAHPMARPTALGMLGLSRLYRYCPRAPPPKTPTAPPTPLVNTTAVAVCTPKLRPDGMARKSLR